MVWDNRGESRLIELISDPETAPHAGPAASSRVRWMSAIAIAVFLLIAILYARAKEPWLDEALQGSAAYSLIAHGQFALPQLEESGMTITTRIPKIQSYCYIFGPAYLYAAAAWLKAFGYGLMQVRAFSMAWAIVAMAAWFVIIERLTRDGFAAALGILLLAVNYQFIVTAANGRFDMMCASLGSLALALYLALRNTSLTRAILFASFAAAAAFFTHPMGALYGLVLVWTIVALDFRRVRPIDVVSLAAPWIIFAAATALWIWPHRDIAAAQFSSHTHARWSALENPIAAVLSDATQRYLAFFFPAEGGVATRAKVLILIIQLVFIAFGLGSRRIRRTAAFRILGPSLLIVYCGIALLDNLKLPYYMVHAFLFASALVAVTAAELRFSRLRYAAGLGIACLMLVEVGGMALKVRENSYSKDFVPTIAYIRSHTSPADYVEGEMSLNFGLGYSDPGFHMDNRMGYYTGVKPSMIVTGQFADLAYFRQREPKVYRFIEHRLNTEYRQVAEFGDYRIYVPR